MFFQTIFNGPFLQVIQVKVLATASLPVPLRLKKGKSVDLQTFAITHDHGTLNGMLKFPYIARPVKFL